MKENGREFMFLIRCVQTHPDTHALQGEVGWIPNPGLFRTAEEAVRYMEFHAAPGLHQWIQKVEVGTFKIK